MLAFPPIAVIVAAYNEEEGIRSTLAELREILSDQFFLVVDGNSVDRTVEIAKELGAEVLLQKGYGKGNAISQAIKYVHYDPEYVIFIDADFTYPCKYLSDMLRVIEENSNVGMVLGNRFNHMLTAAAMKNPFFIGNRFLAFAQRILNGVHLSDPLTGMRVVRWNILKEWTPRSEGFDIEAEMNHLIERQGYKIVEVSIPYRKRLGDKKLKLKDGFIILKRIISESLIHYKDV